MNFQNSPKKFEKVIWNQSIHKMEGGKITVLLIYCYWWVIIDPGAMGWKGPWGRPCTSCLGVSKRDLQQLGVAAEEPGELAQDRQCWLALVNLIGSAHVWQHPTWAVSKVIIICNHRKPKLKLEWNFCWIANFLIYAHSSGSLGRYRVLLPKLSSGER